MPTISTDVEQFVRLFRLAQRPGTPEEEAVAMQALTKRMGRAYPVVWTIPNQTTVTVPGLHPVTGAPTLYTSKVVVPDGVMFEDIHRVKTEAAIILFAGHRYLWFTRADADYFCPLADLTVAVL